MISRGEVGLIVTAMGATSGIFGRSEVAVMVAVVLLTTLITPLALRSAFNLKTDEDRQDPSSVLSDAALESVLEAASSSAEPVETTNELSRGTSFRTALTDTAAL